MNIFCRTFRDGKYVEPPPSLNSPVPPPPKKGKKSEGKEAQKGTKMINYLKINDLHAIFTHFANVENYTFFTILFTAPPPPLPNFTTFWVHP